ncbi:uncharacterized protein LOC124933523 [Impatiens glandulifera]|uniref:uncharacterized protein LOC124933523 n=1 Tax=Impatiens glandulifera TaxID=253017 RepID=UPI001FB18A8E|nr:uncharacterized protein LOC124933523 [Impatiens glandulifera]
MTDSWFSNFWRSSSMRKSISEEDKAVIGISAFEIASLMSKVLNVWYCLRVNQVIHLKEEIKHSIGIRKLVSDDEDHLIDLAVAEITQNVQYVAKSVARLGKRCSDPVYHFLEGVFDEPFEIDLNWSVWIYKVKKMERKVKKMERFVAVTAQLHQELEILAHYEQDHRRIEGNMNVNQMKLLEIRQKVLWQRQEVNYLRESSPWIRTYDYTVRLLLRSLFTVVERIKRTFGLIQQKSVLDCLLAIHQSENSSSLDQMRSKKKQSKLHFQLKNMGLLYNVESFKECITGRNESPILSSCKPTNNMFQKEDYVNDPQRITFVLVYKPKLLDGSPSTLGHLALANLYANIIILIEKLSNYPQYISPEAREDLYSMLTTSIRASLRAKLKFFDRTCSGLSSFVASELSSQLKRKLEWLAPLAHNMIKWQSERNIEKQGMIQKTNILLLQTLYFADQVKTETDIVELLTGLTYISRFGREINDKALFDSH